MPTAPDAAGWRAGEVGSPYHGGRQAWKKPKWGNRKASGDPTFYATIGKDFQHFLGRESGRKQVALHFGAAKIGDDLALGFGFHALSRCQHIEAAGDAGDRAHDRIRFTLLG